MRQKRIDIIGAFEATPLARPVELGHIRHHECGVYHVLLQNMETRNKVLARIRNITIHDLVVILFLAQRFILIFRLRTEMKAPQLSVSAFNWSQILVLSCRSHSKSWPVHPTRGLIAHPTSEPTKPNRASQITETRIGNCARRLLG